MFTFDIQDRSDKRVLDHKHKINFKSLEIIKEKLQSDSGRSKRRSLLTLTFIVKSRMKIKIKISLN